jgi:molecular chaperone DnaJ
MSKRDFYEVLGVARDASSDELKKVYRRLAMQHHPDRNPGDAAAETKFREVSEAYDILKDDQKRAAYDRHGHAAFETARGRGGFDFGFNTSFSDMFDDLFGEMMGARRPGAGRGADLRFNLELDLEESYRGKNATLRVQSTTTCSPCKGSGAAADTKPVTCPACQGRGKTRSTQGFFTIERACNACGGVGRIIENPCKTCNGVGRVRREKNLAVEIPRGVDDGTRIRVAGEGDAGARGGPPGDLYVFLSVKPHKLYRREGQHLHCRVPIPMTTAALGGEIEVPTLDAGHARIVIPPGCQTGKQFRLKGKGMPALQAAGFGDLYVQASVETPVKLTKRQRELLQEFASAGGTETSPEAASFFAKVKDMVSNLKS